jgi:transglutaminase-like putative cysteine protease
MLDALLCANKSGSAIGCPAAEERQPLRRMMKHVDRLAYLAILAATAVAHSAAAQPIESSTRTFEFVYRTSIRDIGAEQGPIHIFLPVPGDNDQQSVQIVSLSTSFDDAAGGAKASIERELRYGNRYWHAVLPSSDGTPIDIEARYRVSRHVFRKEPVTRSRALNDAERQRMTQFLKENARVAVAHPILEPILEEIDNSLPVDHRGNSAIFAREIYDWVVDNIEYKKIGTGWGNGDTFWACNERYGNCTDFHSLFISLARTRGIPARFDMGFPVPEDRPAGNISGYHCWVNFYLPDTGWFPVDASEAFNQPEKRELYYGTQPVDRIHFSTGRDLRLGTEHRDRPLNYFIYPYVEVGGVRFDGPIESSFSYRDL